VIDTLLATALARDPPIRTISCATIVKEDLKLTHVQMQRFLVKDENSLQIIKHGVETSTTLRSHTIITCLQRLQTSVTPHHKYFKAAPTSDAIERTTQVTKWNKIEQKRMKVIRSQLSLKKHFMTL
jgi:hypothetical protein